MSHGRDVSLSRNKWISRFANALEKKGKPRRLLEFLSQEEERDREILQRDVTAGVVVGDDVISDVMGDSRDVMGDGTDVVGSSDRAAGVPMPSGDVMKKGEGMVGGTEKNRRARVHQKAIIPDSGTLRSDERSGIVMGFAALKHNGLMRKKESKMFWGIQDAADGSADASNSKMNNSNKKCADASSSGFSNNDNDVKVNAGAVGGCDQKNGLDSSNGAIAAYETSVKFEQFIETVAAKSGGSMRSESQDESAYTDFLMRMVMEIRRGENALDNYFR
jgi:hypothetical protein